MKNYPYLFLVIALIALSCKPSSSKQDAGDAQVTVDTTRTAAGVIARLTAQIKADPRNYALYQERSEAYYEFDSVQKAITDVDMAISLYRNSPELHQMRGFYAFSLDDTATAKSEYEAAIGLGSRDPETYYQLGQVFFLQKKYPQARELYESAIGLDDRDPQYPFAIGLLEEFQQHIPAAIARYEAAIVLDSTFSKSYARLFDLYSHKLKQASKAEKLLETWLRYDPGHPEARYQEGEMWRIKAAKLKSKDETAYQDALNQAVAAYSIAINRDPGYGQASYQRGMCYFDASQYELAIQDLKRVKPGHPFFAAANFQLGSIYEYFEDTGEALTYYRLALKANPSSKDAARAVKEMEQKAGK